MYKIIALCGKSGSGKDRTLQEIFKIDQENFKSRFNRIINCTTRPPREGEIDGVHYHFISGYDFSLHLLDGTMIEATEHRDWFYGTTINALSEDKINIGVFNPIAIDIMAKDPKISMIACEIAAAPKTCLLRQLNRVAEPDVDEIIRRYGTDKIDFAEMETPCITLINETEDDLWNNVNYIGNLASSDKFN